MYGPGSFCLGTFAAILKNHYQVGILILEYHCYPWQFHEQPAPRTYTVFGWTLLITVLRFLHIALGIAIKSGARRINQKKDFLSHYPRILGEKKDRFGFI